MELYCEWISMSVDTIAEWSVFESIYDGIGPSKEWLAMLIFCT